MLNWLRKRLDNSRDVCGFSPFNTGHDDPFHPACFDHDLGYKFKTSTREEVDKRFYDEAKEIIRETPWQKKLYIAPLGYFYMGMVFIFGRLVWKIGQESG